MKNQPRASKTIGKRSSTVVLAGTGRHELTFGSVTMKVDQPRAEDLKRNAQLGHAALVRASTKLLKPGVKLSRKKGVAHFRADPDQPGFLIRTIDGKTERGTFQGREFLVTE